MSANPANASVRRPAPAARPAPPVAARAAAVPRFDHHDDEFRLNLSDIPRMRESMTVDGLKPTLLSRIVDLVAPLKP